MHPVNAELPASGLPAPGLPAPVAIAILAKAPIPGQAKTRLIPHLGAEGAARLQRWLLQKTVAAALMVDVGPISLWYTPDMLHPDFALCRAFGPVTLRLQPPGDLGQRMLAALEDAPGPAGTRVIGTDCPLLTPGTLERAANCLRSGDNAVVFPAEDGGHVLIGMRRPAAAAFSGVRWGSSAVMAETRERLESLGWRWSTPVELWDVDRPADFERLAQRFPDVRAYCQDAA